MEPAHIKSMLEEGRLEEVSDWLRKEGIRADRDPAYFKTLGLYLEEAGMIPEALLCWNMALRSEPTDRDLLLKIAEVHRDAGDLKKALNYLKKVLDLGHPSSDDFVAMGELLEEMGDHEAAERTYLQGYDHTGDDRLKGLAKALSYKTVSSIEDQQKGCGQEEAQKAEVFIPTDAQLVTFLELFSGREGVYARQWINPKGESGYTPVYEPLTYQVARNHILGNYTVGVYQLRVDNTVKFIAIDIDIAKFYLNQAITSKRLWERAMEDAKRSALAFSWVASESGIPMYVEESGFKGYHCWIFLSRPIPARIARKAVLLIISQAMPLSRIVQIEGFPRQAFLTGKGLGSLIKLPLGIHRKTGIRSRFLDAQGNPVQDQMEFVESMKRVPLSLLQSLIFRWQAGGIPEAAPPGTIQERHRQVEIDDTKDETSLQDTSLPRRHEPYNVEADLQYQYLLARCAVLRALVEKVHQQAEISNDERIVMTYTFGMLEHGVDIVNSLLQRCVNVEPSSYLKSRLGGNPISCPKIRSRIPEVTSRLDCNCQFDSRIHMYPNPLIHIKEMGGLGPTSWTGKMTDSLQFQQLVQEYLKARKQLRELDILIKAYEQRLDAFFEQAGVEQVETAMGVLKRTRDVDGKGRYSLDL